MKSLLSEATQGHRHVLVNFITVDLKRWVPHRFSRRFWIVEVFILYTFIMYVFIYIQVYIHIIW